MVRKSFLWEVVFELRRRECRGQLEGVISTNTHRGERARCAGESVSSAVGRDEGGGAR